MSELQTAAMSVPLRERLSFSFGNFGINLQFGLVNAFLMYFYTDVAGIAAAVVAQLFLAARAIDAVFDPLMGFLVDRTETRLGKHRPFLLFLAIPYAVCGALLFWSPELPATWKLVYVYVTYTLFGLLYSGVSLPLLSMLPTLSKDSRERTSINAMREFIASMAIVGIGYVALPFIDILGKGDRKLGFVWLAALIGVVTVVLLFNLVANTKERVRSVRQAPLTTRQSLAAIKRNWPWASTTAQNFLLWIGITAHLQSAIYYAQHVLGRAELLSPIMATLIAAPFGSAATSPLCRALGKRATGLLGCVVAALGIALLPVACTDVPLMLAASALSFLGIGIAAGIIFVMMADAVDYGEWRSGFRAQGFLFASSAFGVKLGMTIGGAAGAILLSHSGYSAGVAITPDIVAAIVMGFVWLPVACFIGAAVCMTFFVFDKDYPHA